MKILVVENETKLADYLRRALQENGHVVECSYDGINGLHLALELEFDVILLDWMLPGIDGIELLRCLRQRKQTPVLLLTARADVEDRVAGLHEGADDYLSKPFSLSELLARVFALGRRASGQASPAPLSSRLEVADLNLDLLSRKAMRAGRRLDLTSKEFALLALLMRRQGEVLSRMTLAELVWDINFKSNTNVVEVAMRRLRAKVDDPFPEKLLHTMRGMGYICEHRKGW
ncbi:DNA-binding response regulator [Achromobacter xylosoxidans]|uniref:heavy metal response regulator transcription factor n=1 Tax=Achromobacter TaxID=222 RepID=UPI000970C37E|nr:MULTISPECIES: heavy metal response regulator transcription factor [Achromobacter]OMG80415.1 DNA-binding response regulator [Achromobacter xylosoxidans]CAB3813793.1 Transcriptional activator protein CzcR [Achromobacter mucicolens]